MNNLQDIDANSPNYSPSVSQAAIASQSLVCLQDFPGFYNSILGSLIDCELEGAFEYYNEQLGGSQERYDHPLGLMISKLKTLDPKFSLDPWAISENFNTKASYDLMYLELAKLYISSLNDVWESATGFKLNAVFESMSSPKFYNFETDRLFVFISTRKLKAMLQALLKSNRSLLASHISVRFSNRNGFSSFYSNDLTTWLGKPLSAWDHNELGTLLNAYMVHRAGNTQAYDKLMDAVTYEINSGNNELGSCVDAGIDWNDLWESMNLKLQVTYDNLLAEIHKDDPKFEAPALRCPETLELF